MVKSKKPKKQVNLKPEYVLDPNAPKQYKKKTKNAPDRPQPAWMFPPDEENPVLNPKQKSQEKLDQEKSEHDRVIKFLQYRSVGTPVKPPPPALLLTLVGGFLTSYGFNSTSRLYTTELSARKKLDEWNVLLDQKLPKGFPDLVKLFKVGQKTFEEQKVSEETSSSESEDDSADDSEDEVPENSPQKVKAGKPAVGKVGRKGKAGSDESSLSDDSSDSDEEMEESPPATKVASKNIKVSKRQASSSSSSTSDSDADDEEEPSGAPLVKIPQPPSGDSTSTKSKNNSSRISEKPAKVEVRGRGKPGPVIMSSNEETSSEDNEQEDITEAGNPSIVPAGTKLSQVDDEENSSSDDSTSSSDPDPPMSSKLLGNPSIDTIAASSKTGRQGYSSSETLKGASDQKPTTAETSVSLSSSDSETSPPANLKEVVVEKDNNTHTSKKSKKRKHEDETQEAPVSKKQAHDQHKTNAPFERVPKNTPIDDRFNNKYKSYDYADRAYQDLSVTKGKGFTKEKNKKKRGSYRGGAIDVTGGKGTKFDD